MSSDSQFTVRGVPGPVAQALRQRAKTQGKSLNRVLVEALTRSAKLGDEPIEHHDLDWIAGTWVEDPSFDEAIAAQNTIDEELWR